MKKSAGKPELPDLVTAMMKLVERLGALEKKMDQVVSQTSVRPPEPAHHAQPVPRPDQGSRQNQGQRERTLYQAVCADCCKNCEVPFKPSGDRPVYCKECFAKRKAGHVPQDPDKPSVTPSHKRVIAFPQITIDEPAAPAGRGKVSKGKKSKKAKKNKKKK